MKKSPDYDKLRGGYYTPSQIAKSIVKWVRPDTGESILEPSCGDGVFLKSISEEVPADILENLDITAIELDADEAKKASSFCEVHNCDFFTYYRDCINGRRKFDVLIGNPPFIRYQNFGEEFRSVAFELMHEKGFRPNRLTNMWVPFLILSAEALSENGRMGMVIPAELFQVNYAKDVRDYLSTSFERVTVVISNSMPFTSAQQEVVIVLGEKTSSNPGFYTLESDSKTIVLNTDHTGVSNSECLRPYIGQSKWTKYYLTNEELDILNRIDASEYVYKGRDLYTVNVGLVTGENSFFVIDHTTANSYNLEHTSPIVCRTEYLPGLIYRESDKVKNEETRKSLLFSPTSESKEGLTPGEMAYVEFGESKDYDKGFKCRSRDPWYIPPKSWVPDAFFFRQVGRYPRMVLNSCNSQTTDTLHKIRFNNEFKPESVICAFHNSYTFLNCELIGRSYGGGVLTFEPEETRNIPIPMKGSESIDIDYCDELVRSGRFERLIEENDKILLQEGLNLSPSEITSIHRMWVKLCNRRISRKSQRQRSAK